ncbi:MAG: FAD-dependent monooxygenase [Bauldia litoralis]
MYFDWQQQPFRRPPELDGQGVDHPVVIVGAGPVGLAMALALSRFGIPSVVLEARDKFSDGSRAVGVHRRSTQFMDWLGIGDAFRDKALKRECNIVYSGTQQVYDMSYDQPVSEKHPLLVCLQQCWMEKLLHDGGLESGLVDVRWRSSVTAVADRGDGVAVTVETPEGSYILRASYLVAADGARGIVRRDLGLEYETPLDVDLSERRFIINDFRMRSELTPGRRLWLSPPTRPGSIVIMHSQPFDIWRLDYAVEDDEDAEQEATPEQAARRIHDHLAMMGVDAPWELVWTTTYRARARTLPGYRSGRIFFAGDAAHQTPIFGGRGLNLGYADCFNLAWKLAFVLKGMAAADLLDTYSPERRGIVVEALKDLAQSTLFMTRPSPGVALMRDAVLSLSLTEDFVSVLFDAYRARRGESSDGALAWRSGQPWPTDGGPAPGSPVPDARVRLSGRDMFLFDLFAPGLIGLLFLPAGEPLGEDAALAELFEQRGLPFTGIAVAREAGSAPAPAPWRTVVDPSGEAFAAFGVERAGFYLLRPDLYVLGRWPAVDPADIRRALGTLGATAHRKGAAA